MGTITGKGIEAIAVRRASVTDGDKVRYRVYRPSGEYVVVIAENALMAVKVAGINDPLRIERDIVSEKKPIPSDRLEQEAQPSIALSLTPRERAEHTFFIAEEASPVEEDGFTPLTLGDLQGRLGRRGILTAAEMGMEAAPVSMVTTSEVVAMPSPATDEEMGEAVTIPDNGILSPEEVARLLGE